MLEVWTAIKELMKGGVCGICGEEIEFPGTSCGCDPERVKRNVRKQRIKHLTVWIKERKKEIIRANLRIETMEIELKELERNLN